MVGGSGIRRIGRYGATTGALLLTLALGTTVAQAAPTVTLDTPASGSLINERPTTISGTSSDTTDMVTLVVSREGSIREESTLPQSGVWTLHPTLSDGTYSAVARQTELGELEPTSSNEVTFTLDATAPNLTLKSVSSPTNDATPSFGGSGGEGTGEASSDGPVRVEVLSGETAVVSEEVGVSSGTWAFTVPSALADGTYTVRTTQQDQAGNKTERSATFVVDTQAPQVGLVALESVIGDPTPSFNGGAGTVMGASSDSSTIKLTIFAGTAPSGTVVQHLETSRSGASWSTSASKALADGTYTAIAEQADSAGNLGTSEPSTFTVKTKGPDVSLNPISEYTNSPTPGFAGGLGTDPGDIAAVLLEIYPGTAAVPGKQIRSLNASESGGSWVASLGAGEALEDGTYTALATQRDQAHNAGLSIARTFILDTHAPQLTLSAPSESTGLETVSGSAGTATGDHRQVTAELFSGGSAEGAAIEMLTVLDNPGGTWSATFAGLGGGQYTVIARQSDEAGNTGSSVAQSFTVDAPPAPAGPSAPVASFTWVPQTPAVGQSVSFVSKSSDASSAITGYGWDFAGSGPFAAGGALMSATFSTAGAHTVRLQVSDANGLSSTVAETVQVAVRALTLMQPFPIVRIAGAETSGGARIKLLTVLAPPAAKVAVSCKGHGCKTKSETRVAVASSKSKSRSGAVTLAFPRFQRTLGAGATLQIRITKSGQIGKFTSFKIRHRKLPVRADACLRPPSTAPSPCPSQ
jgi:hypothetical protein